MRINTSVRNVIAVVSMVSTLYSQDVTGSVQGKVNDPTGATVPNAKVELVNEQTRVVTAQTSDASGSYIFNLVPPGKYSIRVSAAGFQSAVARGITVEVNRPTRADVALSVGAIAETIQVSATVSRVDAVTAQISTTATSKLITELPSASRNVLKFAELAPGVSLTGDQSSQVMNIQGAGATVNGNRSGRNVFYLDGSDNTASFRNSALQFPNPDAVQELNIATSNTSAEFGKQPGGVFNIITKSGTNEIHGTLFHFFTDSSLNANEWARNRTGVERAPAELRQTGGTIGGPAIRNKLFYFGSYMRYRD
jgi:hypothetical protein